MKSAQKTAASKTIAILEQTSEPAINIALDTIAKGKQALFFLNSKRNAESLAEKISAKIKDARPEEDPLIKGALHLSKPTKQCLRLALVLKKSIAFHHAGLTSQQRDLIEQGFREGTIKIICATPTLAAGVDLPAFRAVIRDVMRYGRRGMDYIPVLEYEQQAGRAGRPGKDDYGEAILIANSEREKTLLKEKYIDGEPEDIFSKLAVEPILRTYCLSLVATNYIADMPSLEKFFAKTFYAHQYGDMKKLSALLGKTASLLTTWGFLKGEDFVSAAEKEKLEATLLGKRTSELYLDPYTARFLLDCIERTRTKTPKDISYLHIICSCLELRPLLRVKSSEQEAVQEKITKISSLLLVPEPSFYDEEYDSFVNACKTAFFMLDWINEKSEDELLNEYDIRPGEIRSKLDLADWLIYSMEELARLSKNHGVIADLRKLRVRLKHGAKEELLPLLKLRNIGRVRARMLFRNNIKSLEDIRTVDSATLGALLGKKIAEDIKEQVGVQSEEEISPHKRKGQMAIGKYEDEV